MRNIYISLLETVFSERNLPLDIGINSINSMVFLMKFSLYFNNLIYNTT
jgi:hypothetical protein